MGVVVVDLFHDGEHLLGLDEAQLVLTAATSRRRYRERVLGEEKMKLFAKVLKERAEFAHLHGDRERARRLETVIHELS